MLRFYSSFVAKTLSIIDSQQNELIKLGVHFLTRLQARTFHYFKTSFLYSKMV